MTFDWSQYTGQLKWLPERTIYLTRHGSHSYGTSTPTSDLDIRGIAVAPLHYYLGFSETFEQAVQNQPVDLTVFELRKFMKLAADANPNALEIVFTDPSDHLLVHPVMEVLFENRDAFLSQKARHTFSGYARAQLKRINAHYRWLKSPPKAPPTRAEFGLPERTVIPADQLAAAQAAIQAKLDSWAWHELDNLDPATRQAVRDEFTRLLLEITQWQEGEVESREWLAAARQIGLHENFIRLLDLERQYTARLREWQQYQDWKRNRNPARAALEEKFGYDCYSDDTEFLTANGWKHFDDVTADDLLATVFIRGESMTRRKYLGIEYQSPIDRFEGLYTGPMYRISGQHTDVLVTPNHRILFREFSRRTDRYLSEWVLEEVSALPDSFDVLIAPQPKERVWTWDRNFSDLPIRPQAYLRLMGWYLSDGCAGLRFERRVYLRSINISQAVDGKLSGEMTRWHNRYGTITRSSLYVYKRKSNEYNPREHYEKKLHVRDPRIVRRMVDECLHTVFKRIPRYIFTLSRHLMETLLVAMLRGDGTKREHKTKEQSYIYYSSLSGLADDVQELGLMCGWETAKWGPYEHIDQQGRASDMYQVHLRKASRTRRCVRNQNVEKCSVQNQRIVCFTVPNGTLIVRRNGRVSIHGNSKHAMHLVRLTRMCRELLVDGVVKVRRPDAQELLEIRNGAWTYEQLVEYSDKQDAELNELVKTCKLPRQPNREKLDQVCMIVIQRMT